MAISKAEWAEIESKIASVDQVGIVKRQELFEKNMDKNFGDCVDSLCRKFNEKIFEIDDEAKKRAAFFEKNRFAHTLDCVLDVLDKHGLKCDDLTPILKYTTQYCKMQEKHESYADWCKTREQGLTERASNKTIFDEIKNKETRARVF